MTNCWEVEVTLTCGGVEHVWRELTPAAQWRIFAALGRGRLTGAIYDKDFKRGR